MRPAASRFPGIPLSGNSPLWIYRWGGVMGKRRSQPRSCCVFLLPPGVYIAMHSDVQERQAMRRKLVVLFVAFASVFGVVACTGGIEVEEEAEEEAEEAKQEAQEVKEEEKEAEEERKEAKIGRASCRERV